MYRNIFFPKNGNHIRLKKSYWNCCPGPSNRPIPPIKMHPNSWQYPLKNYLKCSLFAFGDFTGILDILGDFLGDSIANVQFWLTSKKDVKKVSGITVSSGDFFWSFIMIFFKSSEPTPCFKIKDFKSRFSSILKVWLSVASSNF